MSSSPKVLVVDDHPDTLDLLSTFLSLQGFKVVAAKNGLEALRIADSGVDAIVTDLAMPGMDGAQLIDLVRSAGERPFPVVVVTGQAGYRVESQLRGINSCRVFSKPCDLERLSRLLHSLLQTCVEDCDHCPNRKKT